MPDVVLGGGALVRFAIIFFSGVCILNHNVTLDQRNSTVLPLSTALDPGAAFRPEVLGQFPAEVQTLFGSALMTGGMIGLVINILPPGSSVGLGETEYTTWLPPESVTDASESAVSDD